MNPKTKKKPIPLQETEDTSANYDVLGSYTGVPADGGYPVQDADDL